MTNFFAVYGLFLAKIATIVIAILLCLAGIIAIATKGKAKRKEKIEITKINEKYDEIRSALQEEVFTKEELKEIKQQEKLKAKKEKQERKKTKSHKNKKTKGQDKNKEKETKNLEIEPQKNKRRVFVIDFHGDIKASEVDNLRQEITAILTVATPKDEVLVKIESAGGMIHSYGLAASQLKRIRDRNIPLTAIIDKVAASGGYMMACVADRIFAAPFAILGSIGVITQLPNFNRFLKRHNIDFEQISAGEYKRTLTLFGENTDKGRQKLQQEVEEAHELFKTFVAAHRPIVDITASATGEHWYGTRAKELRLIDDITTSDDYLLSMSDEADLYEITYSIKKSLAEKLSLAIHNALLKAW